MGAFCLCEAKAIFSGDNASAVTNNDAKRDRSTSVIAALSYSQGETARPADSVPRHFSNPACV